MHFTMYRRYCTRVTFVEVDGLVITKQKRVKIIKSQHEERIASEKNNLTTVTRLRLILPGVKYRAGLDTSNSTWNAMNMGAQNKAHYGGIGLWWNLFMYNFELHYPCRRTSFSTNSSVSVVGKGCDMLGNKYKIICWYILKSLLFS